MFLTPPKLCMESCSLGTDVYLDNDDLGHLKS